MVRLEIPTMTINYEQEYNNRARVPEHPQIFARWEREAAAYRSEARDAEIGLRYGPSPRQTIDYFPAKSMNAPLAMFVHGGWWRSLSPASFSQMARGPNAGGVSVAIVGYDLCPQVTIATIVEEIRAACMWLWRRHGKRITVYGHSAGGHLAACMLAQDWKAVAPDLPHDLVPAAYAISGVFDLLPLVHVSMNVDLRLDETEARRLSPVHWPAPKGRMLDAVVGERESNEFLRQSRVIAEVWRRGGTMARYEAISGANHFTVIDALADPQSPMTQRVCEMGHSAASTTRQIGREDW